MGSGSDGLAMNKFIFSQARKLVPDPDREAFILDVQEDITEIDASRLAGLGITLDQLVLYNKNSWDNFGVKAAEIADRKNFCYRALKS